MYFGGEYNIFYDVSSYQDPKHRITLSSSWSLECLKRIHAFTSFIIFPGTLQKSTFNFKRLYKIKFIATKIEMPVDCEKSRNVLNAIFNFLTVPPQRCYNFLQEGC